MEFSTTLTQMLIITLLTTFVIQSTFCGWNSNFTFTETECRKKFTSKLPTLNRFLWTFWKLYWFRSNWWKGWLNQWDFRNWIGVWNDFSSHISIFENLHWFVLKRRLVGSEFMQIPHTESQYWSVGSFFEC